MTSELEYDLMNEAAERVHDAAERQVLINLEYDPDMLINMLDKDDLVAFLLDHFGDFRPDKQRGEAAAAFLAKAVPDCFSALVDNHKDLGVPW